MEGMIVCERFHAANESATARVIPHVCARLNERYEELRHRSGLTVLVSPKDFSTYHAVLRVRYGASDRLADRTAPMGLAHFLEHKMFEKPNGSFDDDFAALGAEVNAYTSDDRTAYLFSCTEHFPEALELLLCMVTDCSVTRASVSRERAIIAEEIRMNTDDPWDRLYATLRRALYRRVPIREEICGSEASIRRITPHRLVETHRAYYTPERMVLAVSGRVTTEAVMAVVDRVFTTDRAISPPGDVRSTIGREPDTVHTPRVTVSMPTAKPLCAIGVKAPAPPDGAAAQLKLDLGMTVLAEMLFSHAGDFYNELFENGRISPDWSYDSMLGTGYAYYTLAGECNDPEEVYAAFEAYMANLHREGLSEAAFDRARRVLYADYVTGFDSTEDIASALGGYAMDSLVSGGHVGLYDVLDFMEAITFAEVCALFQEAFRAGRYAYVAILPPDADKGQPIRASV